MAKVAVPLRDTSSAVKFLAGGSFCADLKLRSRMLPLASFILMWVIPGMVPIYNTTRIRYFALLGLPSCLTRQRRAHRVKKRYSESTATLNTNRQRRL